MTITAPGRNIDRKVSENVNTTLFRARKSRRDLAAACGVNRETMNRRLNHGGWLLAELPTVAGALALTFDELVGDLPPFDEWLTRADAYPLSGSNRRPTD